MQSYQLVLIFLAEICCGSIVEIPLHCECGSRSICRSAGIVERKIDKLVKFTHDSCNLTQTKELHLSWLKNGISRKLFEFSEVEVLKIVNSNLEAIDFDYEKNFTSAQWISKFHRYFKTQKIDSEKNNLKPKNNAAWYPIKSFLNLKTLQIQSNNIREFPKLSRKLRKVLVNKNKIQILRHESFEESKNLNVLNVEENEIFYITEDAFSKNLELKILNLNRNDLRILEPRTLHENPNLEQLHLNWNKIKKTPRKLFAKSIKLEKLFLRGNKITVISKNSFSGAVNLKWIDLASNKIFLIEPKSFANVVFVDLSFNNCINEDFFLNSKKILHMKEIINRNCNVFYGTYWKNL